MWRFLGHHIAFSDEGDRNSFVFPILSPDWNVFQGQIFECRHPETPYRGYDDWLGHFPRVLEEEMVADALQNAKEGRRVHIRGVSLAESLETIREYYRGRGYEDALAKNYTLPGDECLTVSVSLGHALWCEKDKEFLGTSFDQKPLYAITPPLRSPHDLRGIQQALRMGIIMGIECPVSHESFLPLILEKQILSAYKMASALSSRWTEHGFQGALRDVSIQMPVFSASGDAMG